MVVGQRYKWERPGPPWSLEFSELCALVAASPPLSYDHALKVSAGKVRMGAGEATTDTPPVSIHVKICIQNMLKPTTITLIVWLI